VLYGIINQIDEICRSIEINNVLDIPVDFHIHYGLVNFHCWVIINKLKKYKDSRKA